MTTVANSGADAFIKRLPRDLRFYLVFGNDEGLVHERVKGIVRAALDGDSDPMRLTRLDGDALTRDPGALMDEAHAISMFGGHRAIWIEAQARDLLPTLEPLFAAPPRDCTIVVEAGALKKGTALRGTFERLTTGAAIECYSDDRRSLGPLIDAEAREAGVRIAPDVRDFLASLLGSDRMTTRGEIAKLLLYVRGRDTITSEDVEAIVADAAPSTLDAVIDSAFAGEFAALEKATHQFFADGGDSGYLMARLVSRVMLLHRLRLEMDQGRPFEAAAQALFVKTSPAGKAALGRQAERWTSVALSRQLAAVQAAAGRVRRDARMADMNAMRTLWALASRGRSSARS